MRAPQLPDGRLLIPVELPGPAEGFGLVETGEDHPDDGTWLALAEPVEGPQSTLLLDPSTHPLRPKLL